MNLRFRRLILDESVENFYNTGEYTITVTAESLTGDKSNQVSTDIFVLSTCTLDELEENIDSDSWQSSYREYRSI